MGPPSPNTTPKAAKSSSNTTATKKSKTLGFQPNTSPESTPKANPLPPLVPDLDPAPEAALQPKNPIPQPEALAELGLLLVAENQRLILLNFLQLMRRRQLNRLRSRLENRQPGRR